MKLKGLTLLASLALGLLATSARADIVITAPFAGKGDVCEQIAGHWTGNGKAVMLGVINCIYDGKADIVTSKPGELNINNLQMDLRPKESSKLCPAHELLQLTGSCSNGKIFIHNDTAHLDGEIKEGGKKAIVNGTVTLIVPIIGKISPNVDMDLNKQ